MKKANGSMKYAPIFAMGEEESSFFGALARTPWILERRNGIARGLNNRLIADYGDSGRRMLAEAQWRLNAMIPASELPAFQSVFQSNPVGLYEWGGQGEDPLFAQDVSVSGESAQQWKPRMMPQAAVLMEVVGSKSRRLLA